METADRPYITIVSGLPRSGTSLMMQMLHAGGMPILSDGLRGADEDNPRGYWEFAPVMSLRRSAEWVPQAVGKAVKVVHALAPFLPPDQTYRMILMRRNVSEVVASQNAMLRRQGRSGAKLSEAKLAEVYEAQLSHLVHDLRARPEFAVLEVAYSECLCNARAVADKVSCFLEDSLEPLRMASVVESALYRQKTQL